MEASRKRKGFGRKKGFAGIRYRSLPLFRKAGMALLACLFLGITACKPDPMQGSLTLAFRFSFQGQSVVFDTVAYRIASGESIRIDNIQFFISDVYLQKSTGERIPFARYADNIHYVDSDLPETWQWISAQDIPAGVYDRVEFVYGIDSARNRSFMFRNPPESNMFWPESMGGGYHYMKINGYWGLPGSTDCDSTFGFHTGIGQSYQGEEIVALHHNHVPLQDTLRFFLTDGARQELVVDMEVSQWFENPRIWSFSRFGGHIMRDQQAQEVIKENAWNVFSVTR